MRIVVLPFKRRAFREDAGPDSNGVSRKKEFRRWIREHGEKFTYGQNVGQKPVRIVFAWAEGRNPWKPVGEADVVRVALTKNVKDPRFDKRFTLTTRRIRIPPTIEKLPPAKRGQRVIVLSK